MLRCLLHLRSASFKADYAPVTYQCPVCGTPAWEEKYAKRTNVERGFSTLKNPDVIRLYRIRGLVKMSLLVACMFVAHNLCLRMVDEERLAKGLPRLWRSVRRRVVLPAEVQRPAADLAPPAGDSRAP